jgi:hypothetical protein
MALRGMVRFGNELLPPRGNHAIAADEATTCIFLLFPARTPSQEANSYDQMQPPVAKSHSFRKLLEF